MSDASILSMKLGARHIAALQKAEDWLFHSDFCPYLELKKLLTETSPESRLKFRTLFTRFYNLNVGGLTDEFKQRYFELLFEVEIAGDVAPDYATILGELSVIKRKKGDLAMPFSFVSKLVAMHREDYPIYDRHVLAFFKEKAPAAAVDARERILWYEGFLARVRQSYMEWAIDPLVAPIVERLKDRDAGLLGCHVVRLMDFLVWKVGNQGFLEP
jgi:hypothetical protein